MLDTPQIIAWNDVHVESTLATEILLMQLTSRFHFFSCACIVICRSQVTQWRAKNKNVRHEIKKLSICIDNKNLKKHGKKPLDEAIS